MDDTPELDFQVTERQKAYVLGYEAAMNGESRVPSFHYANDKITAECSLYFLKGYDTYIVSEIMELSI